jgi:alpha/beta superfamily hydrolase
LFVLRLFLCMLAGSQLVEVEGADHWFAGRQQQLLQAVEDFVVNAWQHRQQPGIA